eukprot:933519-Pelagomonas_calceolata.AAC.4
MALASQKEHDGKGTACMHAAGWSGRAVCITIKLVVGVLNHEGLEFRAKAWHRDQAPRWLASLYSWQRSESKFTASSLTFLQLN